MQIHNSFTKMPEKGNSIGTRSKSVFCHKAQKQYCMYKALVSCNTTINFPANVVPVRLRITKALLLISDTHPLLHLTIKTNPDQASIALPKFHDSALILLTSFTRLFLSVWYFLLVALMSPINLTMPAATNATYITPHSRKCQTLPS